MKPPSGDISCERDKAAAQASLAAADPGVNAQPLDNALALPARYYADPASHALDRHAIFARNWHLAGIATQFETPSDHLHIEIAGVPLILLRDDAGRLRALHTVCRHRAGPLVFCDRAGRRRLRCRYHGWSYDPAGRLINAPDMQAATDFDPAGIRLPEACVSSWNGLVFVALDDSTPSPTERFSALADRIAPLALDAFRFCRRIAYDIGCNWKVYVDNYLEGYHIPHIHPALNRMLNYRDYRTETGPWHSLQHSPLDSDDGLYGRGDALYAFLWPNAMLNLLPDRLQINRVIALAVDRCRVEFDYYYPAGEPHAVAARHERDHAFSDLVQQEDVAICEAVQRGLASTSYVAGRLNPLHERGVHHFQELVRAAYRASSVP